MDSRFRENDELEVVWLLKLTLLPLYRADGAKVAVKQRALGGHALYGYGAVIMGVVVNHLFELRGGL